MTTDTAEREEETIASVRSDLEDRHAAAVEAKRIETKRCLLEAVVRKNREIDEAFEAIKRHKKLLKEVRNDVKQMEEDDLEPEDLQRLLYKMGAALGESGTNGEHMPNSPKTKRVSPDKFPLELARAC